MRHRRQSDILLPAVAMGDKEQALHVLRDELVPEARWEHLHTVRMRAAHSNGHLVPAALVGAEGLGMADRWTLA